MFKQEEILGKSKLNILKSLLGSNRTAQEIATLFKLNKNGVRRHLEDLVRMGLVNYSYIKTKKGRPKKVYSISMSGRDFISARYHSILNVVFEVLSKNYDEKTINDFIQRIAEATALRSGGKSKEFLDKLGFFVDIKEDKEKIIVESKNCPLIRVAYKNPYLLCEVAHSALLGKLTGYSKVKMEKTIVKGADKCMHVIYKSSNLN